MNIPFNKIYLNGNEKKYIEDALQRGHLSGDGYYSKKTTALLEEKFSLNKVLMTTSGTHALEMAAELIELKEGDEVIMPSFTFTSTANAVLRTGAEVVFSEIKSDTFNLDPKKLEEKITSKTKAVIPVHYAGIGCEMDKIIKLADKYKLFIIEDAAHAVNAKYNDKYLGGIGDFAAYSFHASKNYVSGEGGALVINSSDEELIKKAEIIREKGTNRSEFMRGKIDKYSWIGEGSSYLPSDILMALLYAQLEKMDEIRVLRENIYNFYSRELKHLKSYKFLEKISYVPAKRESNYHIFYLKFNLKEIRDFVLKELNKLGINASFHYIPLHSSPMGKKLGYKKEELPITNNAADTILRLPIYPELKKEEQIYIIESLEKTFKKI